MSGKDKGKKQIPQTYSDNNFDELAKSLRENLLRRKNIGKMKDEEKDKEASLPATQDKI